MTIFSLFVFGCFADDSEGVLTAINRLAGVSVECGLNLGIRAAKLRAATFTDGEFRVLLDSPQFALWHGSSLAQFAERLECL